MKTLLAAIAILAAGTSAALAGPTGDLAKAHIDAIAKGDTAAVTATYAPSATLHWVGGPLDGTYTGSAIAATWGKFAKAQTGLKATVLDMRESMNPKGGTVVADVVFANDKKIPVRYVMVFRDGKLTDEIWQIDPALAK
ncbi:nuclear transport factor 2 family protein [Aurantimonas sp. 22II-16-19i]|uniref:nuclear transport factor 2 family protein n=1 Tax=Aurantimonas sp. 22II-16-19i TaxID=1317114 RepID=UPI0009F7FD93|nr:nuclear transport factor 2 family protein [Aurantimonas sp. 22II-16-19i]ORE86535.1 hypothetical protein ATO4_25960 [Aurantimonas sp. 22II-16-19i]